MAATARAVEGLPSDTNTPSSSHIENEQRWANAGENLAVLNFSEKVRCLGAATPSALSRRTDARPVAESPGGLSVLFLRRS